MLTPEDIYTKLLFKVNKNDTNTNIKVSKGVFVILFNEQKRKYLDSELRDKESSDVIEEFSELLVLDKELEKGKVHKDKSDFTLPIDFLQRVGGYGIASRGECKENPMVIWFIKPKPVNVLLQNSNQQPSFDYQETIAIINSNVASVYKTDFNIDRVFLSYYKDPPDLDISGYTKPDGTPSTNANTGLSDTNLDKILDRTVVEIATNYQDIERLNVAFQRQQLNEQNKK